MSTDAPTVGEPVDLDAVVAVVEACPSVSRLVAGGVMALLPGRRVNGVRIGDDAVEVHVATRWEVAMPAAALEVQSAVAPLSRGRRVDVVVADVDDPQVALPAATGPDGATTTRSTAP